MGKKVLRIPDDVSRDPSLWGLQRGALLTTPRVAFLIGKSVDQVKERRRTRPPKPPLPLKPDVDAKRGSAVWYALGDVLDYLRSRMPTVETARAPSFASFSTFISSALSQDEWPFARAITGEPVDLIASLRSGDLTDPEEECAWLSLAVADYLAQMGQWVQNQQSALSGRRLSAGVPGAVEQPVCARCGKAVKQCACRRS